MKLTIEQVENIARLARLELSAEEKERFTDQLSGILGLVEKMNALDTANVEPMAHSLPVQNVFGADEVTASDAAYEAERQAVMAAFPQRVGDMLKVKNVFGK